MFMLPKTNLTKNRVLGNATWWWNDLYTQSCQYLLRKDQIIVEIPQSFRLYYFILTRPLIDCNILQSEL